MARRIGHGGLVIASNRLPVRLTVGGGKFDVQRSSGGLAAALGAMRGDAAWIGWPGTVVSTNLRDKVEKRLAKDNLYPVFLSRAEEEDFYGRVCNDTLWPLFHYFTGQLRITPEAWDRYVEVNERFTDLILEHSIALPTSFALVGKTLAQADSIARVLDPELDPIALIEEEALEVMVREAERRLEPNRLTAYAYTQLAPLVTLPRRLGHLVTELEQGSLKVGIVPTGLDELEHHFRSIANRMGAAIVVGSLLLASSLLVRVHTFEWLGIVGFCVAALLGLYMVWKIIRTPGEL